MSDTKPHRARRPDLPTPAAVPGARYETVLVPATPEHPRNMEGAMIRLLDGRILLAWDHHYEAEPSDFSPGRVSAMASADRARTWGAPFTLQENVAGFNVHAPAFLRLPSGRLAFFCVHQDDHDCSREFVRFSGDDGATWTEPQLITPDRVRQYMHHHRAVLLPTGRILLPMCWAPDHRVPGANFPVVCWYSDDQGATWHRGRQEIVLPRRGAMEPVVVERRDGSLLMSIRTQLGDQYRAVSHDGGETWTDVRPMGLVGSESPAMLRRIPSTGDLLIIWNHETDPTERRRTPLTAAISRDDGDTWENVRDLEHDPAYSYAYPTLYFQEDEVVLTYYVAPRGVNRLSLKLKILPVGWFYEGAGV